MVCLEAGLYRNSILAISTVTSGVSSFESLVDDYVYLETTKKDDAAETIVDYGRQTGRSV